MRKSLGTLCFRYPLDGFRFVVSDVVVVYVVPGKQADARCGLVVLCVLCAYVNVCDFCCLCSFVML